MTDEQIIKDLKELLEIMLCDGDLQRSATISKAIDLINRQKAEIERLKGKVNLLMKYDERRDINLHARLTEKAKAEAIKEFAERLKEYIGDDLYFEIETNIFINFIDNTSKEMVGDNNGCTSVFGEAGKPKGNHSE